MKALPRLDFDRMGTVASTICAVHCAITGLAFGLLSVLGLEFLGSKTAEMAFLICTISIGSIAVVHGARKHHSVVPALIFTAGLTGILTVHFAMGPHAHETLPGTILAVLSGCCFVLFHVVNLRLAKACGCDTCRQHNHLTS